VTARKFSETISEVFTINFMVRRSQQLYYIYCGELK